MCPTSCALIEGPNNSAKNWAMAVADQLIINENKLSIDVAMIEISRVYLDMRPG